mmetsp:Transcript_22992/g.51056  ORF Transcript_22992/g.51056 Transcript_22992/m.51056 type:complete len:514 (-) Transcript_22992:94-1635(-)
MALDTQPTKVEGMVAQQRQLPKAANLQEHLCANASFSYAEVEASGTAARPLEFPSPTVHRGHRISAKAVDPQTGEVQRIKNVIVREKDFSHGIPHVPTRGYRIIKKLCDSAYGSVRLGLVMKRRHTFHGEITSHQRSNDRNSLGSISEDGDFNSCESSMDRLTVESGIVWESTDEFVVVKLMSWAKIHQLRGRHLEDPVKEIAALNLIGNSSPHVIGSIEVIQDENYLYSIMPYCNGGDLYKQTMNEIASRESGRISESQARHWFRHILHGLNHMQNKGVCHRDLSLENILIHDNRCVIVDMGMSLRVPYADPCNQNHTTDASAGTIRRLIQAQGQGGRWTYMAPEVVARDEKFDGFAIDLWSAGVILFIMLVGRAPWAMAIESDAHFAILSNGGVSKTLQHWDVPISEEACDLLQGMMWRDPSKRLTLSQIANHPWVANRSKVKQPENLHVAIEEEDLEATVKKDEMTKDDNAPKESQPKKEMASRPTSKIITAASHAPSKLIRGMLKEISC